MSFSDSDTKEEKHRSPAASASGSRNNSPVVDNPTAMTRSSGHESSVKEPQRPSMLLGMAAEILHCIANELRLDGDTRALYNLCLASKVLRDVAQPALFNTFTIPEPEADGCTCEFHQDQCDQGIVKFTRAILQREDLAAGVKAIDLNFHAGANFKIPELARPDFVLFSETRNLMFPQAKKGWPIDEAYELFTVLAILLKRLHNLRRMVLCPLYSFESLEWVSLAIPVSGPAMQGIFSSLEEVFIPNEDLPDPRELRDFAELFKLPSLQAFRIVAFDLGCWYIRNPAPRTWNLSGLILQNCLYLHVDYLQQLLVAFSGLKYFAFKPGWEMEASEEGICEIPEAFVRGLENQAQSLLFMDINFSNSCFMGDYFHSEIDGWQEKLLTCGGLHRFERLLTVHLDAHRISSFEDLPKSVQRLVLRDAGKASSSILFLRSQEIMELHRVCPALREVFVRTSKTTEVVEFAQKYSAETITQDGEDDESYMSIPNLRYGLYICFFYTLPNLVGGFTR